MGPTKEMANEYLARRNMVYDLLQDIPGVKSYMPGGAFYFFPDVKEYFGRGPIKNATDFCMYLLENVSVFLLAPC